jgi:hypothetical protein
MSWTFTSTIFGAKWIPGTIVPLIRTIRGTGYQIGSNGFVS